MTIPPILKMYDRQGAMLPAAIDPQPHGDDLDVLTPVSGTQVPTKVGRGGGPSLRRWDRWIQVGAALAGLAAGLYVLVEAEFWRLRGASWGDVWGHLVWLALMTYGAACMGAMVWRIGLWLRYRPMPAVATDRLPSVSVIIPALNEGPLVGQAIRSVAASRYPTDRLEVIVVDDGSTDDTWYHILAAARSVRDQVRVTTLRLPENRGKREALCAGFARARGDVFVTVDSDSVLAPDALRNGVSPLVERPEVGCVAGCVRVLNPHESVITRFLKCTFSLSFRFVRAYQDGFSGVFCTPGALSIYRADVVRQVVDEWRTQQFLGLPATTGEDRAMTNLFLREGWLTAYQGNAVVQARMPATFAGMVRMFLRWARSNIRETVVLFRFLFTPFRRGSLVAFRFNMLLVLASMILPPLLIANSLVLLATAEGYALKMLGVVLTHAVLMSAIYYRNERDRDWVWLFFYKFFWVVGVSWILPYALVTLRNTGWLTRCAAEPVDASRSDPSNMTEALPAMASV